MKLFGQMNELENKWQGLTLKYKKINIRILQFEDLQLQYDLQYHFQQIIYLIRFTETFHK